MAEKGGEGGEERRGVRGKGGIGEGPAAGGGCNYIPYSTDGVPLNFGTENKRCNEAFVPRARAIQSTVQ